MVPRTRMKFMLAIIGLLVAGSLSASASASSSWSSNSFVDPTGSVQCTFQRSAPALVCRELWNRTAAIVHRSGAAEMPWNSGVKPDYRYVLAYGSHYNAGAFFCRSYTKQMICGHRSGHGFSISRAGVRTW